MNYPVVDMKRTGLRIRELMKKNNIRVRDIVEFMGFESEQSVYKWLRGDSLPKVDNLYALGRLFHTSMDDIIMERDGEDENPLFHQLMMNYFRLHHFSKIGIL
ncbi:DNA-binding transcriptional regulator, XRE-family HTH domain [Butyrivibrio sp. ob235]|uniref:helix-turn-helix domain-containing protein n=1 Tax=Butyrivibrio sp. ob235 TaxID=1761780 RepID=UPI0008C26AE4|nr:helix-turn-helix domain-containing protein [Butyrivibrio sp. ob235]SEL92428.1 DNA-binding transcriptional regulator, XRE-family HTH domain [Butyrivibrio sp. ob235]